MCVSGRAFGSTAFGICCRNSGHYVRASDTTDSYVFSGRGHEMPLLTLLTRWSNYYYWVLIDDTSLYINNNVNTYKLFRRWNGEAKITQSLPVNYESILMFRSALRRGFPLKLKKSIETAVVGGRKRIRQKRRTRKYTMSTNCRTDLRDKSGKHQQLTDARGPASSSRSERKSVRRRRTERVVCRTYWRNPRKTRVHCLIWRRFPAPSFLRCYPSLGRRGKLVELETDSFRERRPTKSNFLPSLQIWRPKAIHFVFFFFF